VKQIDLVQKKNIMFRSLASQTLRRSQYSYRG
jgi:hypothetical protein